MAARTKSDRMIIELARRISAILPEKKFVVGIVVYCPEDDSCSTSCNVRDDEQIFRMALNDTLYQEFVPDEELS
jgi:hypothetical protein